MYKVFIITLMIVSFIACNKRQTKICGNYDHGMLKFGIDNEQRFSGLIEYNDESQNIECLVLFHGRLGMSSKGLKEGEIPCQFRVSYYDEPLEGMISFAENRITIQSSESLFPCQRVVDLLGGVSFMQTAQKDYWGFALISSDSAEVSSMKNSDVIPQLGIGTAVQKLGKIQDNMVLVQPISQPESEFWINENHLWPNPTLENSEHP